MSPPRILVAGIGNIFLGDDGFGVEVVRQLATRAMPASVRVVDFGIRGVDLTYALLDGYDAAILVDATPRGGSPGTLYVIAPQVDETPDANHVGLDPHAMDPVRVLHTVRAMGGNLGQLRLVGCEPGSLDDGQPLTGAVAAAVAPASEMVVELVRQFLEAAHA